MRSSAVILFLGAEWYESPAELPSERYDLDRRRLY